LCKTSVVSYLCNVIRTTAMTISKEHMHEQLRQNEKDLKYCHPKQTTDIKWTETILAVIPEIIWRICYDGMSKHTYRMNFARKLIACNLVDVPLGVL